MTWYSHQSVLYAQALTNVWGHIHDEHLTILEISGKGDYKLSAKSQFENFYFSVPLVNTDLTWCEQEFMRIFYENLHILEQIKNNLENIKALANSEQWGNYEGFVMTNKNKTDMDTNSVSSSLGKRDTTSSSEETDTAKGSQSGVTISNSGASDSNSALGDLQDMLYPSDPTEPKAELPTKLKCVFDKKDISIDIPSNQLSQSKGYTGGDSLSTSEGKEKSTNIDISTSFGVSVAKSKTELNADIQITKKLGNKLTQYDSYLKLEIPQLRKKFWNKFREIFV